MPLLISPAVCNSIFSPTLAARKLTSHFAQTLGRSPHLTPYPLPLCQGNGCDVGVVHEPPGEHGSIVREQEVQSAVSSLVYKISASKAGGIRTAKFNLTELVSGS